MKTRKKRTKKRTARVLGADALAAFVRQTAPSLEGVKADNGKLRFDLLPPDAIREVARVLTYGAAKYSDRNWEKGLNWSRCEAALRRHLNDHALGIDVDSESNMLHLAHVATNALFLLAFMLRGDGVDDRPVIRSARSFPFNSIPTSA